MLRPGVSAQLHTHLSFARPARIHQANLCRYVLQRNAHTAHQRIATRIALVEVDDMVRCGVDPSHMTAERYREGQ